MKKRFSVFLILIFAAAMVSALPSNSKKENKMSGKVFKEFPDVEITGIDIDLLSETELSVLKTQVQYCQAMVDADIDTMRKMVSEDMIFVHRSGYKQTREGYFADVKSGKLDYYKAVIENPEIKVEGNNAFVTYNSILTANAYGAKGTFSFGGRSHKYENRNGEWILVKG